MYIHWGLNSAEVTSGGAIRVTDSSLSGPITASITSQPITAVIGSASQPLTATVTQLVAADNNNSVLATAGQITLTAGQTWVGSGSSTLGVVGIQVSLKTDQNCTVYVDQSPDNINWDIIDTFDYLYTFGGNAWTVQAVNSYTRVRVLNNGTGAVTYFRLQTALCPMVEAVPRALSDEGNLRVDVLHIRDDEFGSWAGITPMQELRVAQHVRLVGASFAGTQAVDSSYWTVTSGGGAGGAATVTSGSLVLTCGTVSGSTVLVQSVRRGRYVASVPNYYRAVVSCPAITGTNTRRWGAYDANDGFFFQYDGTSLSAVARRAGVDTPVGNGSFNGEEGATFSIGANARTYEIWWTNKSAFFLIDNEIIHKMTGSTATLATTLSLPIISECNNTGTTSAQNQLNVRVASISRAGEPYSRPLWKNIAVSGTYILKSSAGTLQKIVINSKGAVSSYLKVYDSPTTSANLIATVDPYNLFGSINYDLDFYNGLTLSAVGGSFDTTIIWE